MSDEEKPKKKLGRPFLELDLKQVENLASIQCTYKEIALVMGCSVDTLERNCAEIIEASRAKGIMSLKRAAWQRALKSSDKLMELLLHNYSDVKKQNLSGELYVIPMKDVSGHDQLENDILEVRNLLDAKPKIV